MKPLHRRTDLRRRHALALALGAALSGMAGARQAGAVTAAGPGPDAGDTALQPWQPAQAPALQATDLATGQRRSLADFAGRPLLVNVWATWCGPCRVEMPGLNALAERLGPEGLQFVALNHGEMPERVQRFLAEVPVRGTVLLDRSQLLLKAWSGGLSLPATFLFDAQGRPRLWAQGERDWSHPDLVRAVRSALT
ncbi:TlpA disulfide reductase family protein [Paracidovorax wautersii]|uniref:Thiol-disulfide isomerase/thioredoxin n=1 Tax=Paracidovorax wautersii TaxID=1177982 RepID=A0ABU1I6X6_9BURK|nr:TlpA disulfide reductase family protein [Paracidovorax wautersii]MDR6212965.1 thiol-disulfide isomerase/thioredoxin [Paracidovorax wautersii]